MMQETGRVRDVAMYANPAPAFGLARFAIAAWVPTEDVIEQRASTGVVVFQWRQPGLAAPRNPYRRS